MKNRVADRFNNLALFLTLEHIGEGVLALCLFGFPILAQADDGLVVQDFENWIRGELLSESLEGLIRQ